MITTCCLLGNLISGKVALRHDVELRSAPLQDRGEGPQEPDPAVR